MSEVIFRPLSGIDEFAAAEALQRAVWGEGDKEDPADLMMVIQAEGGLCGGAFLDGRLVGYVFGFPTRDPKVQHSHRLAVLPEARGLGLGARLKFYQRDWCLAQGITRIRWTYDPLRLANAALNIARLGARSSTYLPDYYGVMAGINAGVASDRLSVDWRLDDDRVAALASRKTVDEPTGVDRRIAIPEDFGRLLASDPAQAAAWRTNARKAFVTAFADGLEVVGFDTGKNCYLLTKKVENPDS